MTVEGVQYKEHNGIVNRYEDGRLKKGVGMKY